MRTLLLSLVVAGGFLPILPAETRPNILFILIDDQRYDFLSFLDHPWIETPHIDALARRGVYLDHAYVTTSLCSPSRASILTGQYAHTHKVIDNETPIRPGTPTFPQQLQDTGYHTGFIGKWHMGGESDAPRPGFDYWASFKGQGPYTDPVMNINGVRQAFEGYTTDILTDLAVEYIKERFASGQPTCLYLSHKSIHEDFTPAPRHRGRYENLRIPRPPSFAPTEDNYAGKPKWLRAQRTSWHGAERDYSIQNYGDFDRFFQLYSECMLGVDDSVGRIAEALREIGQLKSTVIIYYSDNGYMMGEHGLIDKRVMYEESIRVPAFVHWPDRLTQAGTLSEFILNIDLGPTVLDIAGAQIPDTMHGRSFLPLLLGQRLAWRDAFVYEYFIDPNAVQTPTIFGLRTRQYSYMTYHGVWDLWELYDMQADPSQRNNLIGEVDYGWGYGTILKFIGQQLPDIYPTVISLDERLSSELTKVGGSRVPNWENRQSRF